MATVVIYNYVIVPWLDERHRIRQIRARNELAQRNAAEKDSVERQARLEQREQELKEQAAIVVKLQSFPPFA